MGVFVGINSAPRLVKDIYVGINNSPRRVKEVYVGNSNNQPSIVYHIGTDYGNNIDLVNGGDSVYLLTGGYKGYIINPNPLTDGYYGAEISVHRDYSSYSVSSSETIRGKVLWLSTSNKIDITSYKQIKFSLYTYGTAQYKITGSVGLERNYRPDSDTCKYTQVINDNLSNHTIYLDISSAFGYRYIKVSLDISGVAGTVFSINECTLIK